MIKLRTIFTLLLISLVFSGSIYGQSGDQVEMADLMRSNGKIYVVVAVALIVMLGLIIYMITLDRKISRMEKKIKN